MTQFEHSAHVRKEVKMALFFGMIDTFFGAFENKSKAANYATNIALVITGSLLISAAAVNNLER